MSSLTVYYFPRKLVLFFFLILSAPKSTWATASVPGWNDVQKVSYFCWSLAFIYYLLIYFFLHSFLVETLWKAVPFSGFLFGHNYLSFFCQTFCCFLALDVLLSYNAVTIFSTWPRGKHVFLNKEMGAGQYMGSVFMLLQMPVGFDLLACV